MRLGKLQKLVLILSKDWVAVPDLDRKLKSYSYGSIARSVRLLEARGFVETKQAKFDLTTRGGLTHCKMVKRV